MNSIGLEQHLIDFPTIHEIWRNKLWPGRTSSIETHSAMTWPYASKDPYDMAIFENTASFFGVFAEGTLVGVNSGHKTSDTYYRSRGLWVDPNFRKQGIAQMLFQMTEQQAIDERCFFMWSIPRKTALTAYQRFGFSTVGGFFNTETSDSNIYVIKHLPQDSLVTI